MQIQRLKGEDDELFGAQSEFPAEKTILLRKSQHFDFHSRTSEGSGLKHYEVHRVEANHFSTTVLRLHFRDFIKFANNESRQKDVIVELVVQNLPGLSLKALKKK